ncbi:hypothetical protein [Foetidibacter luteolus]|uniref:hypothetical protein n=1 Tax=Foetidibacter luteolus TaxID=2608880 RepID=UPI00129ADD31|nr:hypothetical protein [Foetidibacter luteolus]
MLRQVLLLLVIVFSLFTLHAQEAPPAQAPLPAFGVGNLGKNRIRVDWKNPFGESLIQLNVQRSVDSLKNFRTVFSTPSPELPENGFIDTKVFGKMYYRIFYVLSGGAYYFTRPKKAAQGFEDTLLTQQISSERKTVTVHVRNSVHAVLTYDEFVRFKDSIVNQTMDSLFFLNDSSVMVKPYVQQGAWVPSPYIFTNKQGYISIFIPDAAQKKYRIVFFDEAGNKLFTIPHLTEPDLVLDKANFLHAGWFSFELYENEKLKERNKFYLQKEF